MIDHIPIIVRKLHHLASIIYSLNGFRFYGCSLLLIYDGDAEVQGHYSRHVRSMGSIPEEQEDQFDTLTITHADRSGRTSASQGAASQARRSRSVDLDTNRDHPHRRHSHSHSHSHSRKPKQKIRGEVNIRIVDFAHTTTGINRDILPMPKDYEQTGQLGKGYDTKYDLETGLALARFPPRNPDRPDMGFLFGIKSVCEALTEIYVNHESSQGLSRDRWWDGTEDRVRTVFEKAFPRGVEDAELSM